MFNSNHVSANILCNDGSISSSCKDCHRGCCSHHGGCASNYSYDNSIKYKVIEENEIENENIENNNIENNYIEKINNNVEETYDKDKISNSLLGILGIGVITAAGYYILWKRSKM